MTRRRRKERQARPDLNRQDRLRPEFLSMVGQELRRPLTAIKGSAALWLGAGPAPDPAEAKRFCRVISEQVDHMQRLISDLLDAGRIRAENGGAGRGAPELFVLGDLIIDHGRRRATLAGNPLSLTASEYKLLRILSVNAGRCVTYPSLIRQLWDSPDAGDSDGVRTFVKQLRRKLGDDPRRPVYIANERGVGYRMRRRPGHRQGPASGSPS